MTIAKQPTEEQRREFWEWCGCRFLEKKSQNGLYYVCIYPDSEEEWHSFKWISLIDLNNLFKYAVPKLKSVFIQTSEQGNTWCAVLLGDNKSEIFRNKDPALALFWAIWGVIHAK